MSKFYLISDNSVQWFIAIVKTDNDGIKVVECTMLNNTSQGPFLENICSREVHFVNRRFTGVIDNSVNDSHGWTISEKEYIRLREIDTLSYCVDKYNKLIQ